MLDIRSASASQRDSQQNRPVQPQLHFVWVPANRGSLFAGLLLPDMAWLRNQIRDWVSNRLLLQGVSNRALGARNVCIYAYAYAYICMYVRTYVCMYVCMYLDYLCTYIMYTYIYNMHVYIYVYIYIYAFL